MTKKALSDIEIAQCQLEMALRIFFEHGDYISALTLAGAAEEILGKKAKKNGGRNALGSYIDVAHAVDEIFGGVGICEKEYINKMNFVKNMVKHMPVSALIHDIKEPAEEMLHRAITNWRALKLPISPAMDKFLAKDD